MASKTKRSKTTKRRRVGNGAGMCGPFAQTNEHAIGIHTFLIPPPRWQTTEEAIAYLSGEFHEWLMALEDLLQIGAHTPWEITRDLHQIAKALAEFLKDPRPLDSGGETGGAVETLLRSIAEAVEKSRGGKTTEGLGYEIADETLPLLNRALGYAMKARQEEAARAEASA